MTIFTWHGLTMLPQVPAIECKAACKAESLWAKFTPFR
jgi:hypothetical protein